MTEKFQRVGDRQIYYEFTVDDPIYYTQTWRAEQTMNQRDESVYEYACHEGNYAMEGILGGARILEAQGRVNKQGPGIFGPNAAAAAPARPASSRWRTRRHVFLTDLKGFANPVIARQAARRRRTRDRLRSVDQVRW